MKHLFSCSSYPAQTSVQHKNLFIPGSKYRTDTSLKPVNCSVAVILISPLNEVLSSDTEAYIKLTGPQWSLRA